MGTRNRVGIRLLYWPARARMCKSFKEPGLDSQPGGRYDNPTCCTDWPGYIGWWNRFLGSLNVYNYGLRLHWLAELVPWNRFLGSLNIYKYGLRLHWLAELVPWNRFLGSITWRIIMATISKRRRNKASILNLFLISKRNEPSYSRTCKDRSEANPAYSTP
jgi:hypothetical protein